MNVAAQNIQSVRINGERREVPLPLNVTDLLAWLEIPADEVALEINKVVVRKRDWSTTSVPVNAEIEIVQFVGGG